MDITCEKCGGKNTLPKGRESMFCSFCGTNIEAPVKETNTKVSSSRKGSDKETILEYIRGGSKGKLELPMGDLKGIRIKGANLSGANLSGANLADSDLRNVILNGADLNNAYLINVDLTGANLSDADLSGIEAFDEEHEKKKLRFTKANLTNAIFTKANLKNAVFEETNITLEQLRSASNVEGIAISNMDLNNENLNNFNLESASFLNVDLSGANLSKSNFSHVVFDNVNLQNANFSNSDLSSCCFDNSNLNGAKLNGATLSWNIFANSDLSNIDFTLAVIENSLSWCGPLGPFWGNLKFNNSNLSNIDLSSFRIVNTEFIAANLSNVDLSFAILRSVNLLNVNLSGAKIYSTEFYNVNVQNANFYKAIFEGFCKTENTDFKKAKLKGSIGLKNGCYITTACVEAMNLPDDCHELETLRKFRDGFVSDTLEGRKLIKEYYEIAPKILDAIDASGKGEVVFKNLYHEIKQIVSLIDANMKEEAFCAYCCLTLKLKNQYLN